VVLLEPGSIERTYRNCMRKNAVVRPNKAASSIGDLTTIYLYLGSAVRQPTSTAMVSIQDLGLETWALMVLRAKIKK